MGELNNEISKSLKPKTEAITEKLIKIAATPATASEVSQTK
jgi:hypothetical protein